MTIAEQLKLGETDIETDLPSLRQDVIRRIKHNGEWNAICDWHISEANVRESDGVIGSVPPKFFNKICEWAHKEGLRSYVKYSSRGTRMIAVSV